MLDAEFYHLTQSLWNGFALAMTVVSQPLAEVPAATSPPLLQVQPGMAESPGWFLVQAAEFEPEPLTVAGLRRRDVYASPRIVQAILEMMAAEKWFDRQGEAYYLTEAGRTLIRQRQTQTLQALATIEPLIEVDIVHLETLLNRVIERCLSCEDPPGSWCLAHSRRRAPTPDAALPAKLFHYVADINAFRDDVYMAAWRPQGVMGYVWEAFSLVCAGQSNSAAMLYDQLANRGYSRHDYDHALRSLVSRGWLETTSAAMFRTTGRGREIRQKVESLTDVYFSAPWHAALDDNEISEENDLVVKLRQELQALAR